MRDRLEQLLHDIGHDEVASSPNKVEIRQKIMDEFQQESPQYKKKRLLSGWLPKVTASSLALGAVGVFLFSTLVAGPLTAKEVLAQAIEGYSSSDAIGQGRYYYGKVQLIIEGEVESPFYYPGDGTFVEIWKDTESSDEKTVTSTADGEIVDTYMTLGDDFYIYNNPDFFPEEFFEDEEIPEAGSEMPEDFDIDLIYPGASDAGITFEELDSLSPKQLDDKFEAAGHTRYFEQMFGTTDFPAYTMNQEEIGAYFEENGDEDFGELWPDQPFAYSDEGQDHDEAARAYEDLDKLNFTQSYEERLELLQSLQNNESVELIDEQEWYGKKVVGLKFSFPGPEEFASENIVYIDSSTFQIAGGENSYVDPVSSEEVRFTFVMIEEQFSNEVPDFSTEGLLKQEGTQLLPGSGPES